MKRLRPDGELYRGSRLEAVLEALPDHSQQLSRTSMPSSTPVERREMLGSNESVATHAGSDDASLRRPACSSSRSSPARSP